MTPRRNPPSPASRILLVDDEKSIRRTLGEFLRAEGYEVREAEDADVALRLLREVDFDVVVSDIILPQLGGVELLERIRTISPHAQVVMMTGEPTVETASASLRAGATDYLSKPIDKKEILRVVGHVARLKSLDDERRRLEEENRLYQHDLERLVEQRTDQLAASEAAARELSRFNQAVLDALPAHICVLAGDGTILAVNQPWRLFAQANPPLSLQTDVGANYLSVCEGVIGPEQPMAQQVVAGLRAVATGDWGEFSLEYPCHSRDTQRWFLLRATRFAGDGPVRVVVAHLDITSRKQAEERLLEQAALLDAASDAIYVHDLDQTVVYWNRGAERLYGWTVAEAIGQKTRDVVPTSAVAETAVPIRPPASEDWSGELQQFTRQGKALTVFSRCTVLRDEQQQPRRILCINADLTEKKQLESQFLRAQRMEGLGALASGIAHDLNNILTPMLMTAPLLREALADPETQAMVDTLEGCAQRGADIIKQLLTFARGKPGARVALPVRLLIREVGKIVRETFPRDIRLRFDISDELWQAWGDVTQIHQALMNLSVNSRDAMPDGGTLTLAAKNVTVDDAFATRAPEACRGEYICVSVADTGTGIAPENLDRIFDPFFTTKEVGKGTGLGLATVQGIVRGHQGFLQVESRLGLGTCFAIYLPATPEVSAMRNADPQSPVPRGQGELILVVDDESAVRDGARQILESQGYRVVTAANGAEGLAQFQAHRWAVRAVLTDMMMPVMSGPALVSALRSSNPRLPIIGMSGLNERKELKGFDQVELHGFLAKPFTSLELFRVLGAALQTEPIQDPPTS